MIQRTSHHTLHQKTLRFLEKTLSRHCYFEELKLGVIMPYLFAGQQSHFLGKMAIVYHPVNIAILLVSFWAENFGHAILDDIMPAFILLRLFGLDRAPKSDVQLLTQNT